MALYYPLHFDLALKIFDKLKIALLVFCVCVTLKSNTCKTFRQYRNYEEENKNHWELRHPQVKTGNTDLFSSQVFSVVSSSPR